MSGGDVILQTQHLLLSLGSLSSSELGTLSLTTYLDFFRQLDYVWGSAVGIDALVVCLTSS